ncbi:MAG TPA: flagellar biosynthesis anti-sigma factor FlgM [Terracidiphilus sp.]|jgi:negative regulator of flagellin synthesis FlgM|nr:flagellar biosynthesis anti-sigma factor FlgM [Terracidiphilus sp.]
MEIRNSLDGLRSLLGVNSTASAAAPGRSATATAPGGLGSDLATLSSAGNEVSQTAASDGVRLDKVAAIQAALAAGTYNVPASAVASRLVDAMLAGR